MHGVVGRGIAGLGAVIALSACIVNSWAGRLYQDYIENYCDVMLGYVGWSLGVGLLFVGARVGRRGRQSWTGMAMTVAVLSLVITADRAHDTHQIINTGVEGYSSNHEYAVFREPLVFSPDFVTVGLCLNDIADPAVFDVDLGGIGRFSDIFTIRIVLPVI